MVSKSRTVWLSLRFNYLCDEPLMASRVEESQLQRSRFYNNKNNKQTDPAKHSVRVGVCRRVKFVVCILRKRAKSWFTVLNGDLQTVAIFKQWRSSNSSIRQMFHA